MTQYQSFPGVKGSSESLAKLRALRLPSLQDKRFLDVACTEGFFCAYARFDVSAEVCGKRHPIEPGAKTILLMQFKAGMHI